MVSYYKVEDVKNNLLPRPLSDPRLQNISVRPELYLNQNFRTPVEETEHYASDSHMRAYPQAMYLSMTRQQAPVVSYGDRGHGSQSYAPNHYQPPARSSAPAVKTDVQRTSVPSSVYSAKYTSNYANMPRYDTQSNSMMPPAYHTAVQPLTSSYWSMSAHSGRSFFGNVMDSSPVSQLPHTSSTAQRRYADAVRHSSPAQSYAMHSAPAGGVAQSPIQDMKSALSAANSSSANDTHLSYRNASYQMQTPHTAHVKPDMNGFGINGNTGYATQPIGQGYQSYHPFPQAFRN
ncbi:Global transcription regulator sge1 [Elasticomyces elasticus]|nr:Global transcription regulator sge1 [Elasticomyces elasticus]KAK4905308.1 Global transcription regulator sge1 [Elasticomyces elasticus]KAK5742284.1 Global transcription regulator sge1 [Elasticomyces elasticus]